MKQLNFMMIIISLLFIQNLLFAKSDLIRTLKGHHDSVKSVAISSDNKYIVSASADKTIKIWNLKTGKLIKTLKGHIGSVNSIAISSDNKYIVSGSGARYTFSNNNDPTIKIWNLKTGKLIKTLDACCLTYSVTISNDNKYIVASNNVDARIWDLKTGKLIKILNKYYGDINSVGISADNKYIVSGSNDKTIKIWDLDETVKITWDIKTGELIKSIKGDNWVYSVAISSDSKYIVSGSSDDTIKIWNLNTGKLIKTLKGHIGSVNSVAITKDNKYIVSGSSDNTIKIWNLNTGKLIKTLKGHSNTVYSVAISSDNKYIVSGSDDKTMKIWDLQGCYLSETAKLKKILKDYKKIKKINTKKVYLNFIEKYPDAPQAQDARQNIYKLTYQKAKNKNTIKLYQNFIDEYPNAPQVKNAKENIKNLILLNYKNKYAKVKKENNISGYEWFISKYPNAPQVKDAIKNIHKLAYDKAKEINTISAYNTFIISYPYASQVRDANDRAYKLEEKKYTDLGVLGFFGKEAKLEKKARKLLIKAKQIERKSKDYSGDAKAGYIIVSNRMYQLLQDKFDESDATLRYLESQEFKDFVDTFKRVMNNISYKLNNIERYSSEILSTSKQGFEDAKADREMSRYKSEQQHEWEKRMHLRDKGYN